LPSQIAEVDITAAYTGPSQLGAWVALSYGVIDTLQLNAAYDGVTLRDFKTIAAEKAFHLGLDYFFFTSSLASTMLDVDFPLYIKKNVAQNIKVSFPTSIPLFRPAKVGLMILHVNFVDFRFVPYFAAEISLPARIGWQVSDALWLGLGTNFATFRINSRANGQNGPWGHDYIWTATPLYLTALYGISDSFDLTGRIGFGDALRTPGDSFYVWLGIGLRFGKMTN
jgi:hypothetical protein